VTKKKKTEEELRQEAEQYGVPLAAYRNMTGPERGAVVKRWRTRMKSEARASGVSVQEWEALSPDERERRVQQPKSLEEIAARHADSAPEAAAVEQEKKAEPAPAEEIRVYTDAADVPATERDPLRRDGMTIGAIQETEAPPDLLGKDWKPRTLVDLYSRWPVGDGQHYLRVERLTPKVFQTVSCAGFVGNVYRRITEAEFHRSFGGREYDVTLYGPDPKGHVDPSTGNVRVKALTQPIRITVPMQPPNLSYVPQETDAQENKMSQPPWMPFNQPQGPMTPADAQVHKSNVDLLSNILKTGTENVRQAEAQAREAEREARMKADETKKLETETISRMYERQLEAVARQAEERERQLRVQAEKSEKELAAFREEIKQVTGKTDGTAFELLRELTRGTAERESGRNQMYEQQVAAERESSRRLVEESRTQAEQTRRMMEERHREEITRCDDRLKDAERLHATRLEDERRIARDREQMLKDELDRVRNDARQEIERRVSEVAQRNADRLHDLEKAHEREIRSLKESHEARLSTEVSKKDFEILSLRERVETLKESEQEARSRAEESNDPIAVMEKAKQNAEALGYKKEDDGPKTATDRFLMAAGAGIGQFLANADKTVLPLIVGRNAQPPPNAPSQQRQLMQPQQTANPLAPPISQGPPQNRRRVEWAERNAPPIPTNVPTTPLGFQREEPAQQAAQPPPAQAQPMPPQAPPPPEGPQQPAPDQAPKNPFSSVFPAEIVLSFVAQVDQAINAGITGQYFGERFVAQFPREAARLIELHKPEDLRAFVKSLPNGSMSAILRRDGEKFVEGLWSAVQTAATAPTNNAGQAAQAPPPN